MQQISLQNALKQVFNGQVPSQAQLADLAGYSQGYISKVLSGEKPVSKVFIAALIKNLKLSKNARDQFLTALGLPIDDFSPKKIDANLVKIENIVKLTLHDESIPADIKAYIVNDIESTIQSWRTLLHAQQLNHHRDWQVSERECSRQLEAIDKTYSRLTAYLKTVQARAHIHLGEIARAHRQLERTVAAASEMQDLSLKALSYLYQGNIYRDEGKWKEAIEAYEEGRAIFDKLAEEGEGFKVEAFKVEKKIAVVHLFKGEYQKALQPLHHCMSVFKEKNNTYEIVRTHFALAWAYNLSGEWDISLHHHQTGIQIAQHKLPSEDKATKYLIMLGNSFLGNDYRQRREPEQALTYYEIANDMSKEFADKREQGWILLGLARVNGQLAIKYRAVGRMEEANEFYTKTIEYFELARDKNYQIGFWYRLAMTETHYGRFLLDYDRDKKSLDEAESILQSALHNAELIDSRYYQAQARVILCDYYRHQKNSKEFEKYVQAVEQLHNAAHYHRLMARLRLIQAHYILGEKRGKIDFDQVANLVAQAFGYALKHHPLTVQEIQNRLNRIAQDDLRNRLSTEISNLYFSARLKLQQSFESDRVVSDDIRNQQEQLLQKLARTAEDISNKKRINVELLD